MDEKLNKKAWEVCEPKIAHLYTEPRDINNLYERWQNWLRWFDFTAQTVIDYGCGGAFLYDKIGDQVKKYVGLDIAERSIDFARNRLKDKPKCEFYLLPGELKEYGADILICQQVISHFPNADILESFLNNLRDSRIPKLLLEIIPCAEEMKFNKDDIHRSCEVGVHYIQKKIDYQLINVRSVDGYLFTNWEIKTEQKPIVIGRGDLRTVVELATDAIIEIEKLSIEKLKELASITKRMIGQ